MSATIDEEEAMNSVVINGKTYTVTPTGSSRSSGFFHSSKTVKKKSISPVKFKSAGSKGLSSQSGQLKSKCICHFDDKLRFDIEGMLLPSRTDIGLLESAVEQKSLSYSSAIGKEYWLFSGDYVTTDGFFDYNGLRNQRAVRPMLNINNLSNLGYSAGDVFELFDESWIVIDNTKALCSRSVGHSQFDNIMCFADYSHSEIKKFVDAWYGDHLEKHNKAVDLCKQVFSEECCSKLIGNLLYTAGRVADAYINKDKEFGTIVHQLEACSSDSSLNLQDEIVNIRKNFKFITKACSHRKNLPKKDKSRICRRQGDELIVFESIDDKLNNIEKK